MVTAALLASVGAIAIGGCGGGPSEEDVRRSQAEYDLGVGLLHEQNVAGAFQHLQESIRLDPENADAHLLLGNLFLFRGDYSRSEHHLREALRANEAVGTAGRPALVAEANNSLGVLYIHWERYEDAVRVLREATGDLMNRTPHLAWGNLGWAYFEQRDLAQAEQALDQAMRLQPRFCTGWYRLGQVPFARSRGAGGGAEAAADAQPADAERESLQRADDALTRALEVEDEACQRLQEAWRLRGETRARLGRREDAIADFERCVELDRETEAGRACTTMLESTP